MAILYGDYFINTIKIMLYKVKNKKILLEIIIKV